MSSTRGSANTLIVLLLSIVVMLLGVIAWHVIDSSESVRVRSSQDFVEPRSSPTNYNQELRSIRDLKVGEVAKVRGTLVRRQQIYRGPLVLTLRDETGTISVPIFPDRGIEIPFLSQGDKFMVSGKITMYRDQVQIVPRNANDVILQPDNHDILTAQNGGSTTIVKGEVLSKYLHPDGHVFLKIRDQEGLREISVPIFANIGYEATHITPHSVIEVTGRPGERQGVSEVIPRTPADIRVLEPGSSEVVRMRAVRELSISDRGQFVRVRGVPKATYEKNGHTFFTITGDDRSQMRAVLFRAESEQKGERRDLLLKRVQSADLVEVLAMVEVYKDQLELIVEKIYDPI